MKLTQVLPPPTPYERAGYWAHWGAHSVFGDYHLGDRDYVLGVTEDGQVTARDGHTGEWHFIGTWRMAGDDLVIEVQHDLPR